MTKIYMVDWFDPCREPEFFVSHQLACESLTRTYSKVEGVEFTTGILGEALLKIKGKCIARVLEFDLKDRLDVIEYRELIPV